MNGTPKYKRHLSEVRSSKKPLGSLINTEMNFVATRKLRDIFQDQVFDYPKSVNLIKQLIQQSSSEYHVILDSFAGSGTTAHAVLALNQEDGGNRKFILVECEDYADTITAERVRRVIKGVPDARDESLRTGLGGSFTYCTLGDPIDVEGMLTGGALPDYPALAAYLLHISAGLSCRCHLAATEERRRSVLQQRYDKLFPVVSTRRRLSERQRGDAERRAGTAHQRVKSGGRSESRRFWTWQIHRPARLDIHGYHLLPTALRDT